MKADERGRRRSLVFPENTFAGHIINSYMTVIRKDGELLTLYKNCMYICMIFYNYEPALYGPALLISKNPIIYNM